MFITPNETYSKLDKIQAEYQAPKNQRNWAEVPSISSLKQEKHDFIDRNHNLRRKVSPQWSRIYEGSLKWNKQHLQYVCNFAQFLLTILQVPYQKFLFWGKTKWLCASMYIAFLSDLDNWLYLQIERNREVKGNILQALMMGPIFLW